MKIWRCLSELNLPKRKSGKPKTKNENIKFNDYDNKLNSSIDLKNLLPKIESYLKKVARKGGKEMKTLETKRWEWEVFSILDNERWKIRYWKLDEGFWNDEDEDIEEGEDAVPDWRWYCVDNKNERQRQYWRCQ